MTFRTFSAACLLALCAVASAAQTPTPTPGPSGRPPGVLKLPARRDTFTLVCRMGGDMIWTTTADFGVMPAQLEGQKVRVPVIISAFEELRFAKSAEQAKPDGSNVLLGTCGFTHRLMNASDPPAVLFQLNRFQIYRSVIRKGGAVVANDTYLASGEFQFSTNQAFSMEVKEFSNYLWQVVEGTHPKPLP
ncbi:MAG TPA: hypothetical protein VF659_22695 [Pyrinomonadaceae bacterium]|jgi:hypothetical protein